MARQQLRVSDVVVVIPGLLGSVLVKDGKDVWASSLGAIVRGVLHRGRDIRTLELNGDDPEEPDIGDGVTADRLVSDLRVCAPAQCRRRLLRASQDGARTAWSCLGRDLLHLRPHVTRPGDGR
jgi:hypothetical protein